MKRAKNLGNNLMAALLSMAMILTAILPNTTVYAAENVVESESDAALSESAADDETSDESASDNEISDEGISGDEALSETDSDSEKSDESVDDYEASEETEEVSYEAVPDSEVIEGTDEGEEISTVSVTGFSSVGGWNESIYAEIAGVTDSDVEEVSYSGPVNGKLEGDDFKYLVRDIADNRNQPTNDGVRIDIPGLKPGTYTLTVKVGGNVITKDSIEVTAYDRSGYAHFNYTEGVGAYNDDGTLKDNAIVLYVTDENKNTVELKYGGKTITGIGNIFGSSNITKDLSQKNVPLVVRFIGTVSETGLYERGAYDTREGEKLIDGLSDYKIAYDSKGELDGDNGHMATILAGKYITIEGIGYDAVIDGWGFNFTTDNNRPEAGKSLEVRNLKFINTPEDAVGMEGKQVDNKNAAGEIESSYISIGIERCWVHNISYYCPYILQPLADDKAEGDGAIDFKRGQYFTCSYNFFEGAHKAHLVGSGDTVLQYNLTYHHNYWYMCDQRGPLTRNANVHMYNNLAYMQSGYSQNTRADAYIFSEYNMFYASVNPRKVREGAIKSYNDSVASVVWNNEKNETNGTVVSSKSEYVPNNCRYEYAGIEYDKFDVDSALSYIPGNDYKLQTDFTELRKVIASQTGVMAREPKTITSVIESDYSVIPNDAKVNTIDSLPKTFPSFSTTSEGYAFKVDESFDLSIEYADSKNIGVLVNAAGENLLEGNGSIKSLPAGTYMIQSVDFTVHKYSSKEGKGAGAAFKDITIKSLEITRGSEVKAYKLNFDSNGGSEVAPVTIYSNQKYEIRQVSTRDGYAFAGWYDALTGGKLVSSIDGSTLTEDVTVYAHWNKQGTAYTLSLDCDTDLDQFVVGTADSSDKGWNIIQKETVNGFTIHAISGGGGSDEKSPKYYMTVKDATPKTLATNGVLITDKTISGNEDGLLKSIEFTVKGQGVLTVEAALSGSPADDGKYNIVLSRKSLDGTLEPVKSHSITNGTTKTAFVFEFDEAGTYYLYPEGDKGVVYYTLNVHGIEDEEVEQPTNYTVQFDAGDGTLAEGAKNPVIASADAAIDLPSCIPPEGKTFKGWSVGDSTAILTTSYTVKAADADENNTIILRAVYDDNGSQDEDKNPKYRVTFIYDPDGTVKNISFKDDKYTLENNVISVSEGTNLLFKPEPADGYKISSVKTGGTNGMDVKANTEGYYDITISSDTEVVITTAKIDGGGLIDPDSQSGIRIEGLEGPFYYTGAKIIPDITVKDYSIKGDDGEYGKVLAPGVDYTVKYSNNVKVSADPSNKAGKATVTVTGKGNYTGKDAKETFEIVNADNYEGSSEELLNLKGAKISNIAPVSYRRTEWYPAFTLVKDGVPTEYYYYSERGTYETKAGYAIKANWSLSNNINKGTATLLLTGAPDNNGKATTVKKTFKINPVDISKADVDIDIDEENAVYAVKGSTPNVKVTLTYKFDGFNDETVELKPGIDYTVKYSANKNAGNSVGKVVIVGKGNYTKKTQAKTFSIKPLDLKGNNISAVVAYDGLKVSKIKATILDDQKNALNSSQYTLKVYKDEACTVPYTETKLKTAESDDDIIYVQAEAKGNTNNLTGKTNAIPVRVGKNIAKAKVAIVKVDKKTKTFTYTGEAISLEDADLTVTIKENGTTKTLHMKDSGNDNECYEIVGYMNNVNKGTATAIIQGTGEYSGTKTVKFKIVGKTMTIDTTS